MSNRARNLSEPETLREKFGAGWLTEKPMDNLFNPVELVPCCRAYVIPRENGADGLDVMYRDLLGKSGAFPITSVRRLKRWVARLKKLQARCLGVAIVHNELRGAARDKGRGLGY